jgi:hypothetical protein
MNKNLVYSYNYVNIPQKYHATDKEVEAKGNIFTIQWYEIPRITKSV